MVLSPNWVVPVYRNDYERRGNPEGEEMKGYELSPSRTISETPVGTI